MGAHMTTSVKEMMMLAKWGNDNLWHAEKFKGKSTSSEAYTDHSL